MDMNTNTLATQSPKPVEEERGQTHNNRKDKNHKQKTQIQNKNGIVKCNNRPNNKHHHEHMTERNKHSLQEGLS